MRTPLAGTPRRPHADAHTRAASERRRLRTAARYLVSVWPADGYADDIAGDNEGTLSYAAGYGSGIAGQAFRFNGKSYLSAPTKGLPTGNADRTVELWVKLNKAADSESFFVGYGRFGASKQTYHLGTASRTLFFSQWGAGRLWTGPGGWEGGTTLR